MLFSKTPKKEETATDAGAAATTNPTTTTTTSKAPPIEAETPEDGKETTLHRTETNVEYPTGVKLALVLSSAYLSIFLISLDRLIVSTAIPRITDDFHSENDIGWYGSAYLLTTCAFQLLFGKIYAFFSIKGTFLTAIVLFEVGSAICGAAPSSKVFIVGRAVAGLGGSGIMTGVMMIIFHSVPLHKRPTYQGLFGAVFGVSSVLGPILGGVFTTQVSWRWCFYINLPIGGVAIPIIFFLLHIPDRSETKLPLKHKLAQLDYLGTACLVPGCVCLLLALQWGGSTYPWNSWRVIFLLVLAAVLLIAFALVQVFFPHTATIPTRIFTQRTIFFSFLATMFMGSSLMVFAYYLPVWFQAIKGFSPENSGIRTLPLMMAVVAASVLNGVWTRMIGYYKPSLIAGACLMSIGSGLIYTFRPHSPQAVWVGYQFLYGFGLGIAMQTPNLAAQTVLPRKDVSVGTSLVFFSQTLGGAVFISAAQNVLSNQLIKKLSTIPGFDYKIITTSGATSLTNVPASIKPQVLTLYNEALTRVFMIGIIVSCLAVLVALGVEWKSVKANKPAPSAGTSQAVEEGEANPTSEKHAGNLDDGEELKNEAVSQNHGETTDDETVRNSKEVPKERS